MSDPKNRSKTMSNSHNTDVEEDPQKFFNGNYHNYNDNYYP